MIRRTLGGLFAMLGTYYCVLSVRTLIHLPAVTAHWIERSGDPDFKYDYYNFATFIAVGALLVGVLGYRTAVKGIRAALGMRDSWLALAIGTPFLHWFWFLYRSIGNGRLAGHAQVIANRATLVRFGVICLAYLAMWLLMRGRTSASALKGSANHQTASSNAHVDVDTSASRSHGGGQASLATVRA